MQRERFGRLADGRTVERFSLRNRSGMVLRFLSLGGTVTAIETPDRNGRMANVVLGFAALADYTTRARGAYFGALIGRYANRIGGAAFTLHGKRYTLAANDGANALHGGVPGFDQAIWTVVEAAAADGEAAELAYTSPDGEAGFPGTLAVTARYTLADDGSLRIAYRAESDRDTVLNLTSHVYFNLAGEGAGSILDHRIEIAADHYTEIDPALIPTGAIRPVAGTPLDFRTLTPIGARIRADFPQLRFARGYDHNFVLNKPPGTLAPAARVHDPASGRLLEVSTTEPGLQFYSGNFLDGTLLGATGASYRQSDGFALETQHFPDSPNQPGFPSTLLRAGDIFRSETIYRFGSDAA